MIKTKQVYRIKMTNAKTFEDAYQNATVSLSFRATMAQLKQLGDGKPIEVKIKSIPVEIRPLVGEEEL